MDTTPDISKLLAAGHSATRAEHNLGEAAKLGTFRGGSSGAKKGSTIYGQCPRKAVARSLGVQETAHPQQDLMFAAGLTNEDSWFDLLCKSWPFEILQEDETPVETTTKAGTKVTGRPDIVLGNSLKKLLGIELKLVCSMWTALTVFGSNKPKSAHVIQSAFYSHHLKIPYELWYTSRVNWPVLGFAISLWTKALGTLSSVFDNEPIDTKLTKATPKYPNASLLPYRLTPFYKGFSIKTTEEVIYYKDVRDDLWTDTEIGMKHITGFYDYLDELITTDTVGVRPSRKKITGGSESWSPCAPEYCAFSAECDASKGNLTEWVAEIKKNPRATVITREDV